MSRQTARIALDQIVARPALIAPQYIETVTLPEVTSNGMLADLRELAASDLAREQEAWHRRKAELTAAYGFEATTQDKPFAFANGKAIIPIHGILINRFAYSWSFVTGYNFIRAQVAAALADEDVDGIIYDVNSYGGMCAGCPETSDAVYEASRRGGGKPSVAVVDANCYSAAYMVASAADKIVVTPSGGAGSIGVVLMLMDLSGALEKVGVKINFIYAGEHKIDGNPYAPLPDDVRAELQTEIDATYDMFVAKVVRGRAIPEQAVRDTEARCYRADEALVRGLIDAVQTPDDAVEGFFNADEDEGETDDGQGDGPTDPDDGEEPEMATANTTTTNAAGGATPPADTAAQAAQNAATAAAEARAAERARIQGIQGHAEATGRETLAAHLALNTDLSVDAAGGILAASPKQAAPVAAAAPAPQAEANHFQKAMNNSRHPDVGAGGQSAAAGGEEANLSPSQRILAAQSRATGARPPAKPN